MVIVALVGIGLLITGCAGRAPTPVVETRVVVQTRVVVETRAVERTVVVTATPVPTPHYVSRVNVPPGTLALALAAEPASLDPQAAGDEAAELVLAQLYEGLYRLGADGALIPAAAISHTVSPDGLAYTVTLRAGLAWSDGRPVTAGDYAAGACRLLDPAVGSGYASLLTDAVAVRGAAAIAAGDAAPCAGLGVQAVTTQTLRISLQQPAAWLSKLLASRAFWPAPPVRSDGFSRPVPLSNGPYQLAEWTPGQRLLLVKSPNYWNAAAVAIERIELRSVPDPAVQLALYERGELHAVEPSLAALARIQADAGLARELHVLPRAGVSYLAFNTAGGPAAALAYRRAVISALDRPRLVREGLGQPWHAVAGGLLPPPWAGAALTSTLGYDPGASRRILAQAGYSDVTPPPPLEIWFNRTAGNTALFAAVAEMLEAAGIPVRLVSSPWADFVAALERCQGAARPAVGCAYGAYRGGWLMAYADPAALLETAFGPRSPDNYTGWQSPEYERLLGQARATPDEVKRAALYRQAEALLLDGAVVVPLLVYDRVLLVKDGVAFAYPPIGAPQVQSWRLP